MTWSEPRVVVTTLQPLQATLHFHPHVGPGSTHPSLKSSVRPAPWWWTLVVFRRRPKPHLFTLSPVQLVHYYMLLWRRQSASWGMWMLLLSLVELSCYNSTWGDEDYSVHFPPLVRFISDTNHARTNKTSLRLFRGDGLGSIHNRFWRGLLVV